MRQAPMGLEFAPDILTGWEGARQRCGLGERGRVQGSECWGLKKKKGQGAVGGRVTAVKW